MKSISLLFYNLTLSLYSLVASLIAPFNPKARKWVDGRKDVWLELEKLKPAAHRIWFHCSSLGEYEQALPLIEKLKLNTEIVVTFFSPSGYEIVKRKNPEGYIFYLPVDSATNAKRFLDIVHPQMAVFVRYDLWYYYLNELQRRNIKSILISAVFKEKHLFFQWYGSLFKTMLQNFTHIFVQDEHSKKVLLQNGFQNVTKAGDTRIDRVVAIANEGRKFPLVELFKGDKKLLIAGSLEPKDEEIVFPFVNNADAHRVFRFVIAPHHVDPPYIERIQSALKRKTILYSTATAENITDCDILIIDNIGMLSRLYAYADIAYIGGGFGEGLHNILEPAVWNIPIEIGPKYDKFLEAVELVKQEGAYVVTGAEELRQQSHLLLSEETILSEAQRATNRFITERKGATEVILKWMW